MKQQSLSIDKPWVKFYDEGVCESLDYKEVMIWELLEEACVKHPSKFAYSYYGTSVTFRKFMYEIEEAARGLKSIGVKEGDVVTICSPNMPSGIMAFYAVNMIGAIANMVHPLSAEKEIRDYLVMSKSKFVLTIDLACEKIMNVLSETRVERIVVMSAQHKMNRLVKFAYKLTQGKNITVPYHEDIVISWNDLIDFGYMYDGEYKIRGKYNVPAVIMYSGGTTGKQKGIVLTNKNFNSVAEECTEVIKSLEAGKSLLSILPIFHSFGLGICIHTPLCAGVKLILIPTFNYKKFGNLIKQYKPNYIVAVPTLVDTMVNDPGLKNIDLSFVREVVVGGDAIGLDAKKRADEFLKNRGSATRVKQGYGLTEGCGPSCLNHTSNQRDGSIGVPLPDVLYKIVDIESKKELNYGEEGEICISGPCVMEGYLDNKEETDNVLIKDNEGRVWLHTGDIGKIDKDGFVYFTQRLKRMIISSGYNLYPSHIESVIMKHSSVMNVCVVGIPHPYKTQVAKAFIVLKDGISESDEIRKEIKKLCVDYLAKYSIPYEYEFRDSLPKTMVGKVAYKVLEDEEREKYDKRKKD